MIANKTIDEKITYGTDYGSKNGDFSALTVIKGKTVILVLTGEQADAIQALITEEYKKGYTRGVIDNSINKDRLITEERIDELTTFVQTLNEQDPYMPLKGTARQYVEGKFNDRLTKLKDKK